MTNFINATNIYNLNDTNNDFNESAYEKFGMFIDIAKSFERCSYQCVYIIDYFRSNFLYVSKNIARLCNKLGTSTENIDFSRNFYLDVVPEKVRNFILGINNLDTEFVQHLPLKFSEDIVMSCDFSIIGRYKKLLLHHKLTPLRVADNGRIWLALCAISISSGCHPGNVIMKRTGADIYFEFDLQKNKWICKNEVLLSDIERDVILLSAQGYTIKDIADIVCKSVDSVKSYRRSLFQKMEVKNVSEAIAYVQNHQII